MALAEVFVHISEEMRWVAASTIEGTRASSGGSPVSRANFGLACRATGRRGTPSPRLSGSRTVYPCLARRSSRLARSLQGPMRR